MGPIGPKAHVTHYPYRSVQPRARVGLTGSPSVVDMVVNGKAVKVLLDTGSVQYVPHLC